MWNRADLAAVRAMPASWGFWKDTSGDRRLWRKLPMLQCYAFVIAVCKCFNRNGSVVEADVFVE